MGASDSKLVFKQGIHKAQQQRNIPADDPYWAGFWQLPESVEDVFSLFSSADIRQIRDEYLGNLETLVLAVTSRLFALRNQRSFPNLDTAPASDALNCVRVLTRILPYIYEDEKLEEWEEQFFWAPRRVRNHKRNRNDVLFDGDGLEEPQPTEPQPEFIEGKPLAAELIDTLIQMLFLSDFTIPPTNGAQDRVNLTIWQAGVGCNADIGTTKEFDNNRLEILRLLITLCSKSMYTSAGLLPVQGIRALTYMATKAEKQVVLTLLCSLLNATLKYNPSTWHVPYDHVVLKDNQQILVTYCLQLLLLLVLYPVPESQDGLPQQNCFRHFLGKIHRPQDFLFVVEGMLRNLKQPLQANASYLPGSQKSLSWAPEVIMLFWEMLQCNKRFRSYITHSDRIHEFTVLLLFYALHHKSDNAQQGIVRMCAFVLQSLSVEPSFGECLGREFHDQEALPQSVKVPNFRGTYVDYLIISIHALITTTNGKLEVIYPALLATLNNLAPHIPEISPTACLKLMQLFSVFASPEFLFASEGNPELLKALLEAFSAILEYQYERTSYFVLAVLRSQKRFNALHEMILNGGSDQLEKHARLRKERVDASQQPVVTSPRRFSAEMMRSPTTARAPSLSNVPETGDTFTIGDDEDSESDVPSSAAPASHSELPSRAASISSSVEEAVPTQLRGMSEKARGKMPASPNPFSRHGSSASLSNLGMTVNAFSGSSFEPTEAWVESWLPTLPVQTLLTLIDQLSSVIPPSGSAGSSSQALEVIRKTGLHGIDPAPRRIHLFEWSPLSLGWYESLLWGFIFSSEITMFKGAAGVWKGTNVKLFRVQEAAAQGPSLMAPRGAVDAVGNNLVQRIGSLNFRAAAQPLQRNASGGTMRDV